MKQNHNITFSYTLKKQLRVILHLIKTKMEFMILEIFARMLVLWS